MESRQRLFITTGSAVEAASLALLRWQHAYEVSYLHHWYEVAISDRIIRDFEAAVTGPKGNMTVVFHSPGYLRLSELARRLATTIVALSMALASRTRAASYFQMWKASREVAAVVKKSEGIQAELDASHSLLRSASEVTV